MLAGVALVLSLLVKTFLIQVFSIPSGSMENTLQKDDRVLVDKLTPWFGAKPHRGAVVQPVFLRMRPAFLGGGPGLAGHRGAAQRRLPGRRGLPLAGSRNG
ncbi:S26 family signal peptidase [Streptomyces klenkii]|uniref:S26 family signal peptidase n=1 Tax=Streptomyces klenkii TaxID=1420899 RepID=A0A3B0BGH8_9ACTN|nr:S26 family signal peptidase [Streptomyces klenkii]